jgi:hypothetical protein
MYFFLYKNFRLDILHKIVDPCGSLLLDGSAFCCFVSQVLKNIGKSAGDLLQFSFRIDGDYG